MSRRHQFELIQILRQFFYSKNFLETMTPPLTENPGMEPHIHPFQIYSAHKKQLYPLYLHTSPEFNLKRLMADAVHENLQNIYSLSYCFRDEPESPIHRPQFLMLEWYRMGCRYEQIMDDVEELILTCASKTNFPLRPEIQGAIFTRMTMQQLWQETIGIDILDYLDENKLRELIKTRFQDVPLPSVELAWDDLFFLLHLNKVETKLKRWPLLLVYEFPYPLAALSTLKDSDKRVCERFEVYINGIELCNAYNELTNPVEQRERFAKQAELKQELYNYHLPQPKQFLRALDQGLPACAGVALGVERLLTSLFNVENPFFD